MRPAQLKILRYQPGVAEVPDALIATMLEWIEVVPAKRDVKKTDESALRASTVLAAADADGRLIAFAALDLSVPYLLEVHVHKDWRRRGLGSRLVKTIVEESTAAKVGSLQLTVADIAPGVANDPAIGLYTKVGFELVKERDGYSIYEYRIS